MRESVDFAWLTPADRRLLAKLDGRAGTPARRRGGDLVSRLAVVLTAPAWGSLCVVLMVRRVVRRELPVLVFHERVGRRRTPVWVPKIATMCIEGNDRRAAGLIELASGPPAAPSHVSSTDGWLRSTGLDELPQLATIVTGRMRLVGPRPVTPTELHEMERFGPVAVDALAPGLLGVWQLLDRHRYDLEQRRALDAWMLERWSPRLRRRVVVAGLAQAARRLGNPRRSESRSADGDVTPFGFPAEIGGADSSA